METVRTSCGTCHRIGPFPRPDCASKPEGWACVYDDYPPGIGSPDLLANARLIAAAPDLLAALLPFAEIGIGENPDYQPIIRMDRDAIVAARAAIAKARDQ